MRVVESPGWGAEVTKLAEKWRAEIVEDIADDARRMVPVDTGELRASIHTDHPGRVVVGTDHWAPTEYGSRPHVIEAKPGGALFWPGAAHPVAKVNHPGTPEQAFMRPALYRKRTG